MLSRHDDLGRMPKSIIPKVMAFDPCWASNEWDALVRFLAGDDHDPAVEEFKLELEKFTKSNVTVTNSGREAIALSARLLGLTVGDEVICPDFACRSSISTLSGMGCQPVVADIDDSLCLAPDSVEECIGGRSRAILMIHQFGRVQNFKELRNIATKNDLVIIDDSAPAFGSRNDTGVASTLGDVGILSFNYCKTISSIGGGALVGNLPENEFELAPDSRPRLMGKVLNYLGRRFRYLGLVRAVDIFHRLSHVAHAESGNAVPSQEVGASVKGMAGIQAALALAQIGRFNEICSRRRRNFSIIREGLEKTDGVEIPRELSSGEVPLFLPILVPKGYRWRLASFLAKRGYETTWDYWPLHLIDRSVIRRVELPNTTRVWERILLIPVHPNVKEEQAQEMASAIRLWTKRQMRDD